MEERKKKCKQNIKMDSQVVKQIYLNGLLLLRERRHCGFWNFILFFFVLLFEISQFIFATRLHLLQFDADDLLPTNSLHQCHDFANTIILKEIFTTRLGVNTSLNTWFFTFYLSRDAIEPSIYIYFAVRVHFLPPREKRETKIFRFGSKIKS